MHLFLALLLACAPRDKATPPSDPAGPDDTAPMDSSPDDTAADDTAPDDTGAPASPGAAFDRYCGDAAWDSALEAATVTDPGGSYLGYISSYTDLGKGTAEAVKVIPPHPFWVQSIRVQFGAGEGTARIRLQNTWGRSYPSDWPDLDVEGGTVAGPYDVEVDHAGRSAWVEIDVSGDGVFLEPTQHYMIVNEYLSRGSPTVGIAALPSGEDSRSLLLVAREDTPYGIDGNYRMELEGQLFCQRPDADRLFQERTGLAFSDEVSSYIAVADANGDGHQDLVTYASGPALWLNDGTGTYTAADDPWPEARYASLMLFGDLDNDGDADVFAGNWVGVDDDGDGVSKADGDCDDTDAAVYPGATESTNGRDDDCDGVADDGADSADADGDGVSIAAGDCDDNQDDAAPGFPEEEDGRDNDCDGLVDEDFTSKILLNDGTGRFTAVPGSGAEVLEPTGAAGFGDGDEDGNLDLYFGNWLRHYPDDAAVQDRYYQGTGDGHFVDDLAAAGLELPTPFSCFGVAWNDYNDDGHPDILVGNYHLYDNQLWQNQGDGRFVDVALAVGAAHDEIESPYADYPGGHSYGGDFADVDNDGDMDLFIANLSHPRTQPWADPSVLLINGGAPDYLLENQREALGLIYDEGDVNAQFADFDNDMDVDLAIASLYTQHYARLYRNDGAAGFTDITYEAGINVEEAVSVIWADVDEDGDEDLLFADRFGAPYVHLYLNTEGQKNHQVTLELRGTTSNRDGVGARVWLTAGGVTQMRDISDGNGHSNTQRPRLAHFGLASSTAVDAVTVRWVGGGTETFTGVGVDGTWLLVEGAGVAEAR